MRRVLKTTFEIFEEIMQIVILFVAVYLYSISI